MNNQKIVLASITVMVAAGLLALNPSMIGNVQAQMYDNQYGYDNNYYQDDNRYSYEKKDQKSSHVDIQKIKCVNSNVNVNGIDITKIPRSYQHWEQQMMAAMKQRSRWNKYTKR